MLIFETIIWLYLKKSKYYTFNIFLSYIKYVFLGNHHFLLKIQSFVEKIHRFINPLPNKTLQHLDTPGYFGFYYQMIFG